MNNKKMITELTDSQVDNLLSYTLPYTEQNAENIKNLALEKIKPKKRPRYRQILIAASLMLALSIGVSAYYIATMFFAPGYGILQDADFTIYATKQKVTLGNFIIDAVTRTVDGDESTICVWLFREEEAEISEEQRVQGIAPDELENVTIVFNDGTETKLLAEMISSSGFSQYRCEKTPDANIFCLRDNNGNEAKVTLEDISKTEYANLKRIKFDDVFMAVVPLSGTKNIFAAELSDKFTLNLSKYASDTSLNASFFMESSNGDIGHASGNIMLNGNKDVYKYGTVSTNVSSYGMDAEKLMLNLINISHYFGNNSENKEYSITVPSEGESVNCNITLFDAEGIKFLIKSIKNENGVLICETETIDNIKNQYRTKARFDFDLGIYEDFKYEDYGLEDEQGNLAGTVYKVFNPLVYEYNNDNEFNYDVVKYKLITHGSVEINPGDEVVLQISRLAYEYQWDKKSDRLNPEWWKDPARNLGEVNLK